MSATSSDSDVDMHPTTTLSDAVPFSRPPTPGPHPLRIGWYGLGAMGYFMARNIATSKKLHPASASPILVYNRTLEKAEKLVGEIGSAAAVVASSPAQLVTDCDVIFTNLANDAAVQSVYNDFTKTLSSIQPTRSKIFVDTSTIYPSLAAEVDKSLSKFSYCHFVASPVFGPPAEANAGKLVIAMSGDYRSKQVAAHLMFPGVGRKVVDLGGNVEKAPTLKLIGNGLIMGANELLAETLTLGEKSGIGAQTVHNLVREIMPAPALLAYADKMVNDKFDGKAGFAIDLGIKDSLHVRQLAAETNCPIPTIDVAHQHMVTARSIHQRQNQTGSQKWDVLDWSAIIAGCRVAAGLDPFDSKVDHVVPDD
ncbi:NAD(P)-binding protein [Pisolithus croceorrhizus]|nr:NAD(P)-binding protein [Pisolithus croceorrhizus]KAI6135509.1 NAD(P)-binding protein [Pisolithus croceorrhizus]KAI6161452.1 NAD(P)-binding protein [Pisolithus thermaeus]